MTTNIFDINKISNLIHTAIAEIPYPSYPANLYSPIKYTMASGGKRLRPTLMLATMAALGADPEDGINQALGIEMFHNFTLLHDDVMDGADLRRGQPTVHRRWDVNTAILSGDAMLTMAGQFMTKAADCGNLKKILDIYQKTAMEVYEGQQYDMDFESRDDVTVNEYIEMIRLKTSVLIGCACEIGAIMAGANDDICSKFYDYGIYLGLGFQLQDDRLDTFGDPLMFGKQIGGDIVNNKKTWLLISAINQDSSGDIKRIISSDIDDDDKIKQVTEIYNRLGLNDKCASLIDHYAALAIEAIGDIEMDDAGRNYFISLANGLKSRTF